MLWLIKSSKCCFLLEPISNWPKENINPQRRDSHQSDFGSTDKTIAVSYSKCVMEEGPEPDPEHDNEELSSGLLCLAFGTEAKLFDSPDSLSPENAHLAQGISDTVNGP